MKKLNYLLSALLLLSVFALTGCGDDDDDENVNNASALVGTWNVTSISTTGCDDPDDNGNFSFSCDDTLCVKLIFTSSQVTIRTTAFGFTEEETDNYTVSGNTIIVDGEAGNFSIAGNTLTFTSTDPDDGCVATFTADKE